MNIYRTKNWAPVGCKNEPRAEVSVSVIKGLLLLLMMPKTDDEDHNNCNLHHIQVRKGLFVEGQIDTEREDNDRSFHRRQGWYYGTGPFKTIPQPSTTTHPHPRESEISMRVGRKFKKYGIVVVKRHVQSTGSTVSNRIERCPFGDLATIYDT